MCIPIPYYLSNSFVGIQASQRVRKAGSGINEPPKWEILPPHVFKDSSELPKICEDADVKPSPQDAAANIAKQDKGGDAEPKDEAGTAQAGVAGPAGHYKVGTNIPLIQDNDAARISPAILFPTQWDRKEKSTGLEISPSGLRVTYAGESNSEQPENTARSVRADYPVPPQGGVFYYEVTIVDRGLYSSDSKNIIGIGFSHTNVLLNRLPGWEEGSWGYHGDDGNCFCSSGSGKTYGPTYTAGDVIGCIINYIDNTASFTKNGINLGVAFTNIGGDQNSAPSLYPTVGLQTHKGVIEANFGHKKFVFDIEDYFMEQKNKVWNKILSSPLMLSTSSVSSILGVGAPDPEVVPAHDELDIIFDIVKQLIFSHLIHSGYVDTAKSFHESLSLGKSSNGSVNISRSAWKKKLTVAADFTVGRNDNEISVAELEDAIILKAIYNMILSGDIDGAIEKIEKSYAGFLKNNKNIEFCLQCRRFVEIVYKFNESVANKQESREITPSISSENRDGAIPANGTPKIRNLPYRHCPDNVHPPSPAEREALRYIISSGREIYKKFMFEINPAVRSTLVKIFSLSSYRNASDCPVSYLLDPGCRRVIADSVRRAILVYKGYSCASALEIFYRHASAVIENLVGNSVYSAVFLDIRSDCLVGDDELMQPKHGPEQAHHSQRRK